MLNNLKQVSENCVRQMFPAILCLFNNILKRRRAATLSVYLNLCVILLLVITTGSSLNNVGLVLYLVRVKRCELLYCPSTDVSQDGR